MASLAIHYVIASEYCKKNKDVDFVDFLYGTLYPDLSQHKNKIHYSTFLEAQTLEEIANNKIGLVEYVRNNVLNNDFTLGEFMHLLTDCVFSKYILKDCTIFKKINITTLKQAKNELYNDYIRINYLLAKKYKIDLTQLPKKGRNTSTLSPTLLNMEEIVYFIDFCANFDLTSIYEKIKRSKNLKQINIKFKKPLR